MIPLFKTDLQALDVPKHGEIDHRHMPRIPGGDKWPTEDGHHLPPKMNPPYAIKMTGLKLFGVSSQKFMRPG